jgi:uracil phosphoribosyltransferase
MDATVATGAAAMMAIRVLLDHDVKQENINLVRIQFLLSLKSISFLSHIS